jgi:photosystem II stability/assembly factor-like uncharacterized protein
VQRLYAAGPGAVAIVEDGRVDLALEDHGARCLAIDPADPEVLYVGTDDRGVLKSGDAGRSWDQLAGIAHPRVTALAISPVDGAVYAGTEPSSLFVSRDGGESWRELEGLKELPSAPTWSFPPRPWTSHVRAIALSHEDPGLILAGIELGGILRSPDGGESWQDQRPGAQPDCHSLATHPDVPGDVYEAAGGGFAQSRDFGDTWEGSDDGLRHRYVWALAVDRADAELVHVSAASGPGRAHGGGSSDATIYRRRGSDPWEPVSEHLADFPYTLAADPEVPGSLYAGFGDGAIRGKHGPGEDWRDIARVPDGVSALAIVG